MKNGRTLYPDSALLKLLVKANPGRLGTKASEYFEIARKSKTFGDYREAGGSLRYLYWFKGRGKLVIS